jgi:predicted nuclease of predicted toxin-antitoxin system
MSQTKFLVLTDENISNAVAEQLKKRGVDAERVIDLLPEGTDDDALLEYAYQHGYTIVTHDERIKSHVGQRVAEGKTYCGVIIAAHDLQGTNGIGRIVGYLAELNEFIEGGAATLENDVYNRINYIPN